MEEILASWLGERISDPTRVRLEDCGVLGLLGEIIVWHPLDDIYHAPRFLFDVTPRVYAAWLDRDVAGYILRRSGDVATWKDIGDAGTDTDRFFLVQSSQVEQVIDWLNEDPSAFEALGGNDCIEVVQHHQGRGTVVVIQSPDGNAHVRAGYTHAGELACAIIDVL